MYYINYNYKGQPIETIDKAETRKDAMYLLNEYRMAFKSGTVTISRKEH